jgi:hypothetical protein
MSYISPFWFIYFEKTAVAIDSSRGAVTLEWARDFSSWWTLTWNEQTSDVYSRVTHQLLLGMTPKNVSRLAGWNIRAPMQPQSLHMADETADLRPSQPSRDHSNYPAVRTKHSFWSSSNLSIMRGLGNSFPQTHKSAWLQYLGLISRIIHAARLINAFFGAKNLICKRRLPICTKSNLLQGDCWANWARARPRTPHWRPKHQLGAASVVQTCPWALQYRSQRRRHRRSFLPILESARWVCSLVLVCFCTFKAQRPLQAPTATYKNNHTYSKAAWNLIINVSKGWFIFFTKVEYYF